MLNFTDQSFTIVSRLSSTWSAKDCNYDVVPFIALVTFLEGW